MSVRGRSSSIVRQGPPRASKYNAVVSTNVTSLLPVFDFRVLSVHQTIKRPVQSQRCLGGERFTRVYLARCWPLPYHCNGVDVDALGAGSPQRLPIHALLSCNFGPPSNSSVMKRKGLTSCTVTSVSSRFRAFGNARSNRALSSSFCGSQLRSTLIAASESVSVHNIFVVIGRYMLLVLFDMPMCRVLRYLSFNLFETSGHPAYTPPSKSPYFWPNMSYFRGRSQYRLFPPLYYKRWNSLVYIRSTIGPAPDPDVPMQRSADLYISQIG